MRSGDVRKALLEEWDRPKEIRTNDGRMFRVTGVESWAISETRLVVLHGSEMEMDILSMRNIASIGIPPAPAVEPRRQ